MSIQISKLLSWEMTFERHLAKGDFQTIIEESQVLLKQSSATDDMRLAMVAYLNAAQAHFYLGDIENAFSNVLHYKQICEEHGNSRDKYYLYYINAFIYEYEANFEQARQALQQCMEIALEHDAYVDYCNAANFYSAILLMLGQYNDAYKQAELTRSIALNYCPDNLSIHYHYELTLADALIERGNYSEAILLIAQLQTHPIYLQNTREASHQLYVIGKYYLKTQEFRKAVLYFEQAEKAAAELNDQMMQKRIALHLTGIYEALEDYKLALFQMKKYVQLKDNIHQIRLSSKLRELDLKHSVEVVERRANIDPLSGVYNRYYLEKKTNSWLEQARTNGDHICCFVFDVDNFKTINDEYGHLFGDEVIKAIGIACKKILQKTDTIIARYGGDEFIIILKNFGRPNIMSIAQKLFTEVTSIPISLDGHTLRIAISMGIVCNDSVPAKRFTQLFRVADQALYTAKRQGKNQIVTMTNNNCSL